MIDALKGFFIPQKKYDEGQILGRYLGIKVSNIRYWVTMESIKSGSVGAAHYHSADDWGQVGARWGQG